MAGGITPSKQAAEATSRQLAAAMRDIEEEVRLRRGTKFHGEIEVKIVLYEGEITSYELANRKKVRSQ